jgi:uncharacterized coiled-coil DUF342 family protein
MRISLNEEELENWIKNLYFGIVDSSTNIKAHREVLDKIKTPIAKLFSIVYSESGAKTAKLNKIKAEVDDLFCKLIEVDDTLSKLVEGYNNLVTKYSTLENKRIDE